MPGGDPRRLRRRSLRRPLASMAALTLLAAALVLVLLRLDAGS
jgi:hypothetical protein